jgi:hypothetical protein
VLRYERERPGELVHIDTKKLGRFWHVGKRILQDGVQRSPRAGWQHVHVAVDDHSRCRGAPTAQTPCLLVPPPWRRVTQVRGLYC